MSLATAVKFLGEQQQLDGSFISVASPSIEPFVLARQQPALFPTALILDCLQNIPDTTSIRHKAAAYLQDQVSEQGSWNYWDKTSEAKIEQPYPDDLDDTACALAALTNQDATWADSQRLGQFARLLVAAETRVGGPYNTWLIDLELAPQWRHCDLAVNANVGYALSLQGVCPLGLRSYIEDAIQSDQLVSDYYIGTAPVLYFLSRWYSGHQYKTLQSKAADLLKAPPPSALHQALLLSAGSRLGLSRALLKPIADTLRSMNSNGYWLAAALYIDPVYEGRQHYGGSDTLTTAFALEALQLFENIVNSDMQPVVKSPRRAAAHIRHDAASINNVGLRRRYLQAVRQVTSLADGHQIDAAASLVANATTWSLPRPTLKLLDAAALNGWVAYTLYDKILDGNQNGEQLNVANLALRRSYDYFSQAAGHLPGFTEHLRQTFDTIDGANDWELQHTRQNRIPDYGDLSQLAERSWGHSLAASAVFGLHYGRMDHPQISYLQLFFKHFLIARQLNDDAHDWQEDLRAGQLSAVVCLLLTNHGSKPNRTIHKNLEGLRLHFWQHTIDDVSALIRRHLSEAHKALSMLEDIDSALFIGWLDALEAAVVAALQGRDEAVKFIDAYKDNHVAI